MDILYCAPRAWRGSRNRGVVAGSIVAGGILALAGCGLLDNGAESAAEAKLKRAQAVKTLHNARLANATKVKANEAGQIPVLMYHQIVENPASVDDRSPKQFRAEMKRLATEGYVPITAAEYATGRINVPAGRHPVVLTFDDATPSQLTLDDSGIPKQGTAVAILREIAEQHKGFRPVATFFVTRDMFHLGREADQRRALAWLEQNGFEVGNHTKDHINLRGKPKGQVTGQIAGGHSIVTDLGGRPPVTLALPYGSMPKKKAWARRGENYTNHGVFLAGYNPAPSPFAREFDSLAIPRIRTGGKGGDCGRYCSAGWLDWLDKNAARRYTSDGDSATIAVPKSQATEVAEKVEKRALIFEMPAAGNS